MSVSVGRLGFRIEGVVSVIDAFENDAVRLHVSCDVQKFLGDFAGGKLCRLMVFLHAFSGEIIALHREEDLAFSMAYLHDFTIFRLCAAKRVLSIPVDGHDDESVNKPFIDEAFPIDAACDEQFIITGPVLRERNS